MNPYDYALAKCKLQTQRFGVPVKDGQVDKDSYWAWYSWWKEYIAKMCYPINFGHLKEMTRERKFHKIRPEGDWSNNVK